MVFHNVSHADDILGENIQEALTEMLDDWGLMTSKMVYVTCDSGSNMVKACELLKCNRLSCFGHNLDNAVSTGLKCDEKISRAIAACRNVFI